MARESKRKRDERRFGKAERLADIIATTDHKGWATAAELIDKGAAECIERVRRDVASSPVILAENVGEFFFAHPREYWTYKTDFPCLAPPFPSFFVEMKSPERVVIGKASVPVDATNPAVPRRFGCLFDVNAAEGNRLPVPRRTGPNVPFDMVEIPGAKWFFRVMPIFLGRGDRPTYLSLLKYFAVSEAGEMVEGPHSMCSGLSIPGDMLQAIDDELSQLFMPCLLAISFMNCKNTTIRAVDPDKELNRERQKHGFRPFLRYHTINIEPMKQVLRAEGNIEVDGLKKALHICRGHFSHYTEEKPLFGKHAGTFYVPSHTRGSQKQGVVVSDYKVNPPSA